MQGLVGWQEWAVASDATPLRPVPEIAGVSPSAYLGVLGHTGLTAWVGMNDIGRPQPGETVVVSAAAGAVGSVAGQIAKLRGARVVGIAGGPEKCALLTERLGSTPPSIAGPRTGTSSWSPPPRDGIDVDFENVGGEIMDAVFARLNLRARVVLCGLISAYNDPELPPGPRNFVTLLVQRVRLQGFLVLDHLDRIGEAVRAFRLDRRGRARRARDRGRRLRAAPDRDQHAVRRGQRRQARRARRRRLSPRSRRLQRRRRLGSSPLVGFPPAAVARPAGVGRRDGRGRGLDR